MHPKEIHCFGFDGTKHASGPNYRHHSYYQRLPRDWHTPSPWHSLPWRRGKECRENSRNVSKSIYSIRFRKLFANRYVFIRLLTG